MLGPGRATHGAENTILARGGILRLAVRAATANTLRHSCAPCPFSLSRAGSQFPCRPGPGISYPAGSAALPAGAVPDQVAQGAHRRQALRRAAQHQAGRTAPTPELEGQGRQRPAGAGRASISSGSQARYGADAIRPRPARAGPDDRCDAPPGARVQEVEELAQRRRLRFRSQIVARHVVARLSAR